MTLTDGARRPRPADRHGSIAAQLGHGHVRTHPTQSGRRFYGVCSCGYVTTTRTSEQLAGAALIHHVRTMLARWRANGAP